MNQSDPPHPLALLPNLGAEEGEDWRGYPRSPQVRTAAHLWALLYSRGSALVAPTPSPLTASALASGTGAARLEGPGWPGCTRDSLWPPALAPAPDEAVWPWLEEGEGPVPWLATATIQAAARGALGQSPRGPDPEVVARLHDKAWADRMARELGLISRGLAACVEVLAPTDLADPAALVERLEAALARWPGWTRGRFTLKPRQGTSGRGRIGGQRGDGRLDGEALRGALPRLAERGGAVFEPWLERLGDLSVVLRIPTPGCEDARPTIVGSLEMLASPSGVFRGHCGEVDNRGRVFSGDPQDESLRADAAAVAHAAQAEGFFGPCGVDAFRYLEDGRERLRGLVEFNARATMGLVTLGIVRRALPQVRQALELVPGARRAFLLTILEPGGDAEALLAALTAAAGPDAQALDLATPGDAQGARPLLVFGRSLAPLRSAHRDLLGC